MGVKNIVTLMDFQAFTQRKIDKLWIEMWKTLKHKSFLRFWGFFDCKNNICYKQCYSTYYWLCFSKKIINLSLLV